LAKVILLGDQAKLEPKQAGYCQLTLAEPLLALRGDHFIVRDETAQRTLAGGVVIYPWAERHKRGEKELSARLAALHNGDAMTLSETFLDEGDAFALPIEAIHQFLNLREDEARRQIEQTPNLRAFSAEGEKVYTTEGKWRRLTEKILGVLKEFHGAHPLAPGMDMEELRGKLGFDLPPKIFRVVVETLINGKAVAKEENLLRLASHRVQLGGQEKSLMDKIKKLLGEQPLAPPDLKEIERLAAVNRAKLNEVIRLLERDGSVVRITTDMYFLAGSIDELRMTLKKFLSEKGEMTAAAFRDLIGSSRKYTIPLLEHFDREGLTIRIGDIRKLKSPPSTTKPAAH
jgi:selenocysteine-specific elongation factor